MRRLDRVARLEREVSSIPVDARLLGEAFETFRRAGVLPEDQRLAARVVVWADTGVDPGGFDDDAVGEKERMVRAYVAGLIARADPTMEGLRREAVFAVEPVRGLARQILVKLAECGEDPSEPMFRRMGLEPLELTCASVALSWIGFPHCVAPEERWEEVDGVVGELRRVREALEQMRSDERQGWFEALARVLAGDRPDGADGLLGAAAGALRHLGDLFGSGHRP